jgi:hypothetical protein
MISTSSKQTELSHMIQLTTAANCLAMLRSRNAVKRELQKHGLKVSAYSAREITSWATVYLDDHSAELIPEAIANARAMIASGALGKRAQKAFIKELQIEQSQGERSVANGQS